MRCYKDTAPDGAAERQPVLTPQTHVAPDASAGRRDRAGTADFPADESAGLRGASVTVPVHPPPRTAAPPPAPGSHPSTTRTRDRTASAPFSTTPADERADPRVVVQSEVFFPEFATDGLELLGVQFTGGRGWRGKEHLARRFSLRAGSGQAANFDSGEFRCACKWMAGSGTGQGIGSGHFHEPGRGFSPAQVEEPGGKSPALPPQRPGRTSITSQ
jgi:hypothetical protein